MTVAIMTPTLAPGDGVGNDVLGMANALTQQGQAPYLAALRVHGALSAVPTARLAELLGSPDDLFIYHHSIECAEGLHLLGTLPCRKVVKYHNITPPHFFQSMNPQTARLCEAGLRQFEQILAMGLPIWADSPFNARELQRSAPDRRVAVLPPFNQVEQLIQCEADVASVAPYDDWRTNVLLVGRVVPNKNVLLAVDAFAALVERHEPDARLIIAGDFGKSNYTRAVMNRIKEKGIERHVVITGKVTSEQLKALYLIANALLVVSGHEGFCLPLVEAMGLRVPIVATPTTAIPDTAGDVPTYVESSEPTDIADALHAIGSNAEQREELLNRGWRRYREQFRNEMIGRQFLELVERITEASGAVAA